jgi:hypothetical protein
MIEIQTLPTIIKDFTVEQGEIYEYKYKDS